MQTKWLWALVLLLGFANPACSKSETKSTTLDNGLKVVVRTDNRAPIVVSQLWYKVGSSYERRGYTGISHALEHMMFKGTSQYGPGVLAELVANSGGDQNAFTGYDFTVYYEQLDKNQLPLVFELEADRMKNLLLKDDAFTSEQLVIEEERRWRTDDRPEALARERFFAAAYISGPYQNPVIGWMDDIKSLNATRLKEWYQTWYAPNNAILVVVGDVNADSVFDMAHQYFGTLPKSTIAPTLPIKSIQSLGERRIQVNRAAQVPRLYMGYNVPVLNTADETWEPYALEVLSAILGGDDFNGRISRELIRNQEVAVSGYAEYDPYALHSTLFILSAIPGSKHSLESLEQGIRAEVKRLQTELVTEKELTRVKTKLVSQHLYQQDSMMSQALRIGMLEAVGHPFDESENYLKQVQAITPEQLKSVANRYLLEEHLTVTQLIPKSTNETINESGV